MNEKILVVDDEKEIADLLEVYLKNDNYIVHKYYNGIEALECIQKTEIDLAILDVMLPDIDGFRICQKIRENYYFPVIMLTAKIDDGDKIMGLTIGADDYITKPFNPLEVIARVKTQLRRYQKYNNPTKKQFFPKSEYDITLPDGSTQTWRNTNTFLDQTSEYYNENVKGIKTGSLSNDYNLVVLYQQHGKEFLICSLGSQSDSSRYDDVNYILKTIDESDYLTK